MNILLVNTNNSAGGATKSCYRLHQNFLRYGYHSKVLINDTPPKEYHEIVFSYEWFKARIENRSPGKKAMDKLVNLLLLPGSYAAVQKEIDYQNAILSQRNPNLEVFTFDNSHFDITEHPLYQWADIIHFHWVSNHFVDFKTLQKITKPIVWTLHDMNPFTGGCHYSSGCEKYQSDCSYCPQLNGTIDDNYSMKVLARHRLLLSQVDPQQLTIVSPSKWLFHCSSSSNVFKKFPHQLIPYGIDSSIFKMRDKAEAKSALGISADKKVVLFVAYSVSSVRKGFDYLSEALKKMPGKENLFLLSIGSNDSPINKLEIEMLSMGMIRDEEKMSWIYNAADVFIIPSLEDNLPNTVLESIMCGTPVIGFPVGGIPDMIQHKQNGLLTEGISVDALVTAIQDFFARGVAWDQTKIATEAKKLYEDKIQVDAYLDLYTRLLTAKHNTKTHTALHN